MSCFIISNIKGHAKKLKRDSDKKFPPVSVAVTLYASRAFFELKMSQTEKLDFKMLLQDHHKEYDRRGHHKVILHNELSNKKV